ncbi:MAG: non-canonical purine NTP pyrophosphatase, partial [Eubacteriales bacterium]
MIKLVLASRNKKKIAELKSILKDFIKTDVTVLSLDDIGYYGEIEENGRTFEENAVLKASVPAKLGYIGIADDSGLCVDALGGAPGIYSARFSGGDDEDNNDLLLKKMEGQSVRDARYVCAMACVFPDHSKD